MSTGESVSGGGDPGNPDQHGFSVEKTAACGQARLQVPVCGFLSGADGRMHQEVVSLLSEKLLERLEC